MFTGLTMVAALLSLYAALVVYSRVDRFLLPSRQLSVNIPSVAIGPVELDIVPLPLVDKNEEPNPEDRKNILVLGLDRRPDEGDACTRADSFFVASFDPNTDSASVLSFPRDMYIDIPDGNGGTYKNRINTTTYFGCEYDYPGGPAGLAKDTLALNFGIQVDNYVIIDFLGFQSLIDSIGGIDINVPEAISEGTISFTPGYQHMNGERALYYARLRPDGDYKRIERQQAVVVAAAEKAMGLGLLNNPIGTYKQYQNSVETDASTAALPGLALLAKDIGLSNVETYSMACYRPRENQECVPALQDYVTPEGAFVEIPIWDISFQIINNALPDPALKLENSMVGITAGDPEDVEAATAYLVRKGIPAERIVTTGVVAPPGGAGVFNLNDKEYTSEKVAEWLGIDGDNIETPDEGVVIGADVVIRLDSGFTLPDEATVRR